MELRLLTVGAQRLSASSNSSQWPRSGVSFRIRSAQRLSASSNSSQTEAATDEAGQNVLNAFRHHRIHHPSSHSTTQESSECSTPFGIIEFITSELVELPNQPLKCSTPFGIIEFITRTSDLFTGSESRAQRLSASSNSSRAVPLAASFDESRAQRLSASSNSSPEKQRVAIQCFQVLNAFRHHRIHHISGLSIRSPWSLVLNAFRHHRIHH